MNNNLIHLPRTNPPPNNLPIDLPHPRPQHPRPRHPLPLTLPPQNPDILQPALPHRHGGFDPSQAIPETLPVHGLVDSDDRFVLARRGADDFGPPVVFEDEVFGVPQRYLDGGCLLAWGWCWGDDGAVGWGVGGGEVLLAGPSSVWWWWGGGGVFFFGCFC